MRVTLYLTASWVAGTTGLAALETGRNFVGIEISPEYMELAKSRIYGSVTAY